MRLCFVTAKFHFMCFDFTEHDIRTHLKRLLTFSMLAVNRECSQECWKITYFGIYTATAGNFMFFWYEFIRYATCTKIPNKYHHAHAFPCHKVLLACFGFCFLLCELFQRSEKPHLYSIKWKRLTMCYFCVKMGCCCYHYHCTARPTHIAIYFYHFRCVLITIILIFLLVIFGVYIGSACTPNPCVCIVYSLIQHCVKANAVNYDKLGSHWSGMMLEWINIDCCHAD